MNRFSNSTLIGVEIDPSAIHNVLLYVKGWVKQGADPDQASKQIHTQKAASLYSALIPAEKRTLLNSVNSNSTWAGGELAANFRKPSDMIAFSNQAYQRKKATSPEENDLFDIWRPGADEYDNWEIYHDYCKIRQLGWHDHR